MVYAFFVCSISSGTCKVLYSVIFANEKTVSGNALADDQREINKKNIAFVASKVQSEFSFRGAVNTSISNAGELAKNTGPNTAMTSGIFRLYPAQPFTTEKIVIWKVQKSCGMGMICERYENRIMAEAILVKILKFAQQHCNLLERPHEVVLKPDRMEAVLHHFLPSGQLLFMNHRVVRQLEKELNLTINNKS
ncbi:AP-5 complex subunit sigma-1-like [Xenia sp. Carnegie-2017]|uniref:AP-5 complex subunit sigma-1-like n=1 Tax=Xenia sp. Carnegie-2017 TaxID=2897299 RepID=UPI001F0330F9|nr:AP-5 complex subunit sigma-1-like [Xenia sp. Carnegie-2017]